MLHVGLNLILLFAGVCAAGAGAFLFLARRAFKRSWDEFRTMRQERLVRASGLLSPALERARLDPFRHLPEDWVQAGFSRFESSAPASPGQAPLEADPLLRAIRDWEQHHRQANCGFFEALSHAAHHRLIPHTEIRDKIEPIGTALLQLVEECPEPSLQKELRLAYSGLKTGEEQNLDYVQRRLRQTAHESHSAFREALGNAHSQLTRVHEEMLQAICREADEEIEKFLEAHRGLRLNPITWGRQAAYYREFEQLRNELELARRGGDLSQVALIVVMIVEDEQRFVRHLHEAIRTHDELHQRLSAELRKSSDQLQSEAHTLSGWAAQENQRLQSTVSHQLIQHLEKWQSTAPEPQRASVRISEWIAELAKLRDQDPELAAQAA